MGPIKAALETITRYMAAELGPKGISVHAVTPGPIRTRTSSGLKHFDALTDTGETPLGNHTRGGAYLASAATTSIPVTTLFTEHPSAMTFTFTRRKTVGARHW